jgi:uncharacterized damage-inducible protein DinB
MLPEFASLFAKLEAEREAVALAVRDLGDADLDRPGADRTWSIRQILAHLVASEAGLLALARHIAAGENPQMPPGFDLDVTNQAEVAKRTGLPVPDLLKEWEARRAKWRAFLESLTEAHLDRAGEHPWFHQSVTVRQLVIIMLKHERGHKLEVARLLENKSA